MSEDNPTTRRPLTSDRAIYLSTENYVRHMLRVMGQGEDAHNPRLVGRVVSKIIEAFPIWTDPQSDLRKSDEELERG